LLKKFRTAISRAEDLIIMSNQQPRSHNASRMSTIPSQKPRQLSHLHSQLAQLSAHISDLEQLLKVTAIQAEHMRNLGGYTGALYVAMISLCDHH